jgi:hypothetical protein
VERLIVADKKSESLLVQATTNNKLLYIINEDKNKSTLPRNNSIQKAMMYVFETKQQS